jgi:4-diphosphocytidyl-2C-methyl-D-erythritol kinase
VLRNDLFVAAREIMPRLGDLCSRLESLDPIAVSMTGSGSALYALFPDLTKARTAGGQIQAAGTEVIATAFRPREERPGA